MAEKPTNKAGQPAVESVERRAGAEGNAVLQNSRHAPDRKACPGVGPHSTSARQRKKEKFTALRHHISAEHLEAAFFELKENAAPGVGGLTWEHTRRPLIAISRTCNRGSIEEHIGRCPATRGCRP